MVTLERHRVQVGASGAVSAVAARPDGFESPAPCAVVLAHGAGADMTNPLLSAVHEGLAAAGYLAVKFNFPYTERRARAPDRRPVLESCYRDVLAWLGGASPYRPRTMVIGGKSLGGRIASYLAATGTEVAGVLFLGYPLHPAGQPTKLRADHLATIAAPMLFFAGTRDALCHLDRLRPVLRRIGPRASLHLIEGGDHSFHTPRRLGRSDAEVWAEVVRASVDWLSSIV
jgi:predicted alpha/beta-hydrolase family hydrolase